MVFNATFSNISDISWRPVVVVEEAGVPGENHRPWASNCIPNIRPYISNQMKYKKYHTVGTIQQSNRKVVETDTANTYT
jgi:hypothetical protein